MVVDVVTLQPAAIVDHVCLLPDAAVAQAVGAEETGGSRPCDVDELKALLSNVPEFNTKAGGSAANVARALAAGFGVSVGVVGACGADEWGLMFLNSLQRAHVSVRGVRTLAGAATGRSVILTASGSGQRTMRTALSPGGALSRDMLTDEDFAGVQWLFLSAYALYQPGLLRAAAERARRLGVQVMLDLASWEVVRAHGEELRGILAEGLVACCICNEDEAQQLMGRPEGWTPELTLRFLATHCRVAVVTLGAEGCAAARAAAAGQGAGEELREAAVPGMQVLDTTGAGDAFSSGFLYGLLRGLPLHKCASIGCLAGAAAVQAVGADLGPAQWQWLHQRMHSGLAAAVVNNTPREVYKELLDAYALIARIGEGVVYFGSARLGEDSALWAPVVRLARAVAALLGAPTWTGGGPGMMRAASEGAAQAGAAVGAIRISREAGQAAVRTAPVDYLPPGAAVVCRHMPTRKAALTDCGVRRREAQRTAYVFLPGGLGTMDELFALLTLVQLKKLDTIFPVPLIVCNFDGFYDGLMAMLEKFGTADVLHCSELEGLHVARDNEQVLDYLARFYGLEQPAAPAAAGAGPVPTSIPGPVT